MKVTLWLLALLAMACGSVMPARLAPEDLPAPTDLTEEWGCGHGFWVGDPEQTQALRFSYRGEGPPKEIVELPHPDWDGVLELGTDLFANWCDDVIETDEPTPVTHWSLEIVSGGLELVGEVPEDYSGGSLAVVASDLGVEMPDGQVVPLGSMEITNPNWGFFAG